MSTELRNVPNITRKISQTRFWGGEERRSMLQLTIVDRGTFYNLQVTREEAEPVAKELMLFANNLEVEADL